MVALDFLGSVSCILMGVKFYQGPHFATLEVDSIPHTFLNKWKLVLLFQRADYEF